MNRKNTILLAVLINAGLLLVLFVTALSSKDETVVAAPAKAPAEEAAPAPLFGGDELDLALRQPTPIPLETPVAAPVAETQSAAVVHALPPLAVETPVAAAPIPAPAAPTPASIPASQLVASMQKEVIVKKGDSLEKIAKAHHTSVDELLKLNHLSSSFLRVGQLIKVPQGGAKPAKPVAVAPAPAEQRGSEYYVVKVGDTPWTVAMKHHLKVEELLKLNGLNEEKAKRLKAGDRLRIR